MTDSIRRGEEALARVRAHEAAGPDVSVDDVRDMLTCTDAFEALLKIVRGEDEEANVRASVIVSSKRYGAATVLQASEALRAASGLGEGDDASV